MVSKENLLTLIIPILRKHEVMSAYFYGSYARGDYRNDSDLDVIVSFVPWPLKREIHLEALRRDLIKTCKKWVDVLDISLLPYFTKEVKAQMERLNLD